MKIRKQGEQEYRKICAMCEYATPLCGGREQMLCRKEGVVSADHRCRKFSFDPLKRQPLPKPAMPTLGGFADGEEV